VLYELSGFGVREVGEILGWSESRVKVTLHRARRRLRDLLRECPGDGAARLTRDHQTER
jgi:DNA-directed RNA polymerase specialized sigma24 family protein